jgi:predicted ATPase
MEADVLKERRLAVIHLKALGGLRLESRAFSQPKPLLLLTYLGIEGIQQRKHLAELFWQTGDRMKSLGMTLLRLRQGLGEGIESDDKKAWTTLPSDVKALLEALDKSQWQQAAELYTGAFLEGVVLEDWGSELEEWVYTTREYLAERVQHALLNLSEEAAQNQDFAGAGDFAERAYTLPGLAGTDLTNLKRLYRLLCAGENLRAPDVRKQVEGYGVTVHLTTQEARVTFKPTALALHSLPVRNTSFVGRDEELAELATVLNKRSLSLLTLLGPAGVGKTRLALQLAHEQQKLGTFKNGVFFVPLDTLTDPSLLFPILLNHFGLTQQGKPEPLAQLIEFIAERRMLLVLDNFEQLTGDSALLSQLLSKCPNLILLITSREKLNLEEEYIFTLEGLPYPETPSADAKLSEAVQLFIERAQQVQPRFEVDQQLKDVIKICQLVEGLPLGIELSASWVRLLSCGEIASEIKKGLELLSSTSKNVPERHRSLRAAFEQSWKLLTPKEQEVLRKLSVFVGGFRRQAASEVAGATIPLLASLMDKSLLRVLPNGRYDRHPLLYQFTREKLGEKAEEQTEAIHNHTAFYVKLAAEAHFFSREGKTWLYRFDEELDNVRTVLGRADGATGLRLATDLAEFWYSRGLYEEARSHLTTFLGLAPDKNSSHYVKGLYTFADFAWEQGDFEEAKRHLEEALSLAKDVKNHQAVSRVLKLLARIYQYNYSDHTKARTLYAESIAIAARVGDKETKATALKLLGLLVSGEGDVDAAQTFYDESLTLWREIGHTSGIADILNNLAVNYDSRGDYSRAASLYEQSHGLYRELNEKEGIALTLYNLGNIALRLHHYVKAAATLAEALALWRDLGDQRGTAYTLMGLGQLALYQGDYREAHTLFEESHSFLHSLGYKIDFGLSLTLVGSALHALGKLSEAEQRFQEALEICRSMNDTRQIAHTERELALLMIKLEKFEGARAFLEDSLCLAGDMKSQLDSLVVLEGFAELETALGQGEKAASLWGACDMLRQTLDSIRDPLEQKRYDHAVTQLLQGLGKKFNMMLSQGKTMTLAQALELAVANPEPSPQQTPTATSVTKVTGI